MRKQYIINQDFQFRYIGLLIGVASIICLVFVVAAKYYINLNLNPLIESGLISSPLAQELIQVEKNFLNKNLLTIFLVLISVLTLVGIFITHRIAGPIYALERRMKQIAQEGFQHMPFHVRKNDEFQELVENFNTMMESLQKKYENTKDVKQQPEQLKKVA
ncbi:MAG: hypothetical protein A2Z91_03530 [Deltaproteobacteria bacterium GWA2_38_16]|nr:MAG: hypothetical protein A2Z91_03530 [Deltaproteobacteria bacterium GWA2_38_16]OGQ02299.1 MAG: hypothetical protein A3D19_05705 [Deltaproteobacteria bacterium RIFCSPHIGHO2_02_FULL_38_15]OGQ34370.1 MAG: hypothetical protein A3A72_02750 [Deltaproteobacteria bacterium RIFCSPLOWO2_01_FULL_38_9]OGQ63206.1 MAG: hypothetical protein A3G92_05330 [Deltaproteobacteria bacterium RIFCSPLOWO2_12_FULL_38_8]HBQ22066.1 hypothetical protein [Deltaproteobacteria bacterium]